MTPIDDPPRSGLLEQYVGPEPSTRLAREPRHALLAARSTRTFCSLKMSLQLWFQSFDWHRFDKLLHERPKELAELITDEITFERELAFERGYESQFNVFPVDSAELTHAIRRMIAADDWYACFEDACWPSIDWLLWKSFSSHGFLGAAIATKPRTSGVLMEASDVACATHPHHLNSETYRMGHRRFRHEKSPVYPDETHDDPGYSIHDPEQVRQILVEISAFDYNAYPCKDIRDNFRDSFLLPIRECSEQDLAIVSRWS
jgi:hypothetical protein